MSKYKYIIFDLDGTLSDSKEGITKSVQYALEKVGIIEENLDNLKNKSVLILGCGGVGGYVVESLARSGIGTLILIDYDVVDETNINRQIIALESTIGMKKIDVYSR